MCERNIRSFYAGAAFGVFNAPRSSNTLAKSALRKIAQNTPITAIKMQLRALALISGAAALSTPRGAAKGLAVRGGGLDVEQIAS
jgi:hypothetical protein